MPGDARAGYWGFAVVESETVRGGGETPEQKRDAFERLQKEIEAKSGRDVTATFGADRRDALSWPVSAHIEEVHLIKRLFGYPQVTEFDLYLRVTAKTEGELTQAFRFLDRHCGVEGYM
jgi:hypothetical protein